MALFGTNENRNLEDVDLITKYRFSHDKTYLGELFLRYTPYVFGVALKHLKNQKEAEELTMTVFNKVSTELKRIEIKEFSPWLYQMVKNFCNVEMKKRNAPVGESKKILMEELTSDENNLFLNASDDPEKSIDPVNLRLAVDTLNESQKVCIDLFYMQNKSYNEVSDITGYSINQVKTNIQNGKRLLKTYLENKSS